MEGKIKVIKNDEGYAYPVTVSEAVYVNSTENLNQMLNNFNDVMGEHFKSYVIDLDRWDLNNNPTNFTDKQLAELTSIRLNNAIKWAKEQGYLEVILPKGTYLIDEYEPIKIPSYTTFNLGGSTLRIRDNAREHYSVILIDNDTKYVRITNGEIVGDKNTHDYDTKSGTHEWGMGISVEGHVNFVSIDHMDIHDCIGDAIYTEARPNVRLNKISTWERGAIDLADGTLTSSQNKIRLVERIRLDDPHIQKYGRFGIYGDGWGRLGSEIQSETFDVLFYDDGEKFISSLRAVRAFDDVIVPDDAQYVSLVLYQNHVPSDEHNSVLISIGVGLLPRNIYIAHNNLHHSRRCGIAPTGRHIYIKNNNIYSIRGGSPGSVIDVEDGYKINQFIHIEGNNLYDCKVGVSFVSTQHVFFTENNMDRMGTSTVWGDCKSVVISNNVVNRCTWDIQGDAIFTNNNLNGAKVQSRHRGRVMIQGNYLYNSELSLNNSVKYNTIIHGNTLYNDPDNGGGSTLGCYGEPQTLLNNEFIGALSKGATHSLGWQFKNNKFIDTGTLSLCAGLYDGCVFNDAPIQFRTTDMPYRYEFINCDFKNIKNVQFFASYNQPMSLLRIKGCRIYGQDVPFIFFRDMNGRLELIDNMFDYETDSADNLTIIEFLTSRFTSLDKLLIDGNWFYSNANHVTAISSLQDNITPIMRFSKNTLNSVKQTINNDHVLVYGNVINNKLNDET